MPVVWSGPPEFDAARWCARVGGVTHARSALDAWITRQPALDRDRAYRLLGLEMLMQAGARELVKDERGERSAVDDAVTHAYLAESSRLLDTMNYPYIIL